MALKASRSLREKVLTNLQNLSIIRITKVLYIIY